MSQSTLDQNMTPEGATNEQGDARQATPARRRRHPAPRARSGAQQTEATGAATATEQQPAAEVISAAAASTATPVATNTKNARNRRNNRNNKNMPETPATSEAASPVAAPVVATANASETPENVGQSRPRPRTRSQRSRSGTRGKGGVQLVISPNANGGTETAAETATSDAEPDTTPAINDVVAEPASEAERNENEIAAEAATPAPGARGTASEIRLVPVTTPPPAPVAPPPTAPGVADGEVAALAAASTPVEATEPPATARRYRFDRRPSATIASGQVRPERLASATSQESAPASAAATNTNSTNSSAIVSENAGVRVEPERTTAAPALGTSETAETHATPAPISPLSGAERDAIDDIVSALGLRGAPSLPAAAPVPTSVPTPATPSLADEAASEEETAEPEATAAEEGESESQQGSRRRRRRRRGTSARANEAGDEETEESEGAGRPGPEPVVRSAATDTAPLVAANEREGREGRNGYDPYNPYEGLYTEQPPYSPYLRNAPARAQRERTPREQPQPEWDIANAQEQIRQAQSPFGGPEPSFARGFGPQPQGVAGPVRETYTRPTRTERGVDAPPISPNQLAATITNAIQQQTDHLLSVLRQQQTPPSMTVTLPAFPSTERVGVFVDVANLLYSSRSMRISIDFGRLLDFLRGNRRLIRAHAYAPTNPDPHAEQAFLSAVKGLGYRITTKNYKTFSSGAKKADMDLDLCMDIVRLVDSEAVDTIVLVSGDSDFLPLLEYCSDHGVRVEVAAFDDSAAMILRQSCDLFINLSLVDDIRA